MASKYKAQELFQLQVNGSMSKYHPNQGFTDLTTDITIELTDRIIVLNVQMENQVLVRESLSVSTGINASQDSIYCLNNKLRFFALQHAIPFM